eukprot:3784034-Amphidinium_carterae.1
MNKATCCAFGGKLRENGNRIPEVLPYQSNARSCDGRLPCRVSRSMDILLGTLQGNVAVSGKRKWRLSKNHETREGRK